MDDIFSLNTIIIIFIILFPGIIIRRSFYSNKFSKQFYRGQFSERIITTLFWGIINIIFALSFSLLFFKLVINISCISCVIQDYIYETVTFDITKKGKVVNNISFLDASLFVFLFIFNLFILPFLIGKTAFIVVRKLKLDLKYTAFSFSNQWHYFFKGEIIHKTDGKIIDKDSLDFRTNNVNLTVLDILTLEGDNKYIYKGILLDYNLKEENEELDSIILFEPMKKNYDKDKLGTNASTYLNFEKIPGSFILIPYSHVLNINVTIKPFQDEVESPEIIPENNAPEISDTEIAENPNGCALGIGLIILITVAVKFAQDISYLRFVTGLFMMFMFLGFVTILITNIRKNFSIKKLFILGLLLLLFYNLFIWIFNINIYNPAKSLLDIIDLQKLLFWKTEK